jgi:hypothetical protein
VLSLLFDDFIEQIEFAMNESIEESIRERWINGYQHVPLSEFKESLGIVANKKSEKVKDVDEILVNLKNMF